MSWHAPGCPFIGQFDNGRRGPPDRLNVQMQYIVVTILCTSTVPVYKVHAICIYIILVEFVHEEANAFAGLISCHLTLSLTLGLVVTSVQFSKKIHNRQYVSGITKQKTFFRYKLYFLQCVSEISPNTSSGFIHIFLTVCNFLFLN
jgi:hypothetical protein